MRGRSLVLMIMVAVTGAAVSAGISASITKTQAQAPATSATAVSTLKTPWSEPDLQGIWTDESDTPLQRPAKYANQEFFTETQRAELDQVRAALAGKDKRAERGTDLDVGGSYNQLFVPRKHTGARTSMIADPPDGRIRGTGRVRCRATGLARRRPEGENCLNTDCSVCSYSWHSDDGGHGGVGNFADLAKAVQ